MKCYAVVSPLPGPGGCIEGDFYFATDLFTQPTAERFLASYVWRLFFS